ncbi:hypothetical protein C0J52_01791 [Blattella germanica]|nr:hypothetical protein C0J52_01791 [Blattella germanica]
MCQAMLTRDDGMNGTFFSSIVTMDETWMPFFNPLLHQQFSSGQNRLLEKRSQRQWHHGEDIVKNVYVYRGIMWRSDKSFRIFAHLV